MILIGQYDSPFVRRVAIALDLQGFAFEHKPWSVFGDAEKVTAYNPVGRVPTLVLDDGEGLIDSWAIIDALDGLSAPGRALFPADVNARRAVMKVCALAVGAAEKAVSMVYEQRLHQRATPAWMERCKGQIAGVLDALEIDLAARRTPYWFADAIGHADIAVACAARFISDAHKDTIDLAFWPMLSAHSARCEAVPAFQKHVQTFV